MYRISPKEPFLSSPNLDYALTKRLKFYCKNKYKYSVTNPLWWLKYHLGHLKAGYRILFTDSMPMTSKVSK